MNKIITKKQAICFTFLALIFVFALLFVGCSKSPSVVLTMWVDANGELIEFSEILSDENPSLHKLPPDTNEWHYYGWVIKQSEGKTICQAVREEKIKLSWIDNNGNLLETQYRIQSEISSSYFELPPDTDEWHYYGWAESRTQDGYLFSPLKKAKLHVIWENTNGEPVYETNILEGDEIPSVELPSDSEKWHYTEWSINSSDFEICYTANKIPNADFFIGNVFQIVTKNDLGEAICSGSGFVINEEGWFITNNHVMEKSDSAIAFFDIKDRESGSQYTRLNIIGGIYYDSAKDFFIGKIEGYDKIKNNYHSILLNEEYLIGDTVYSVGYPNSSVKIEINSGKILEEYSDIYAKINDIYYILSDSYIAPGSSGGILTNDNLEVIGITTIGLYSDQNKTLYEAGGSIPTFVFLNQLKSLDESELKNLKEIHQQRSNYQ